jgi:adenylyl cyclase-associated protein
MSLPAAHVEQAWQSAEFYSNKIMMEFRNSEPAHVDWVKSLKAVLTALIAFVKKYYVAGPAWNPAGPPVSHFKPGAGTSHKTWIFLSFGKGSIFACCLGFIKGWPAPGVE